MARIRPFSAFRYDLGRVKANDIVTQPYDKISPDMRQRYLKNSPYNLVRVILGEKHDGDSETDNVYTRAAGYLKQWIGDEILRRDPEPGIYPYTQTFTIPGTSQTATRRGFIAIGGIEDYANKVIFRHEQTLSGPKVDRQNLLRATHTHFGQIFMLYSDPGQTVEKEILARAQNPILEATDEYGTVHRLFRETDPGVIERLQQQMNSRQLIIADGHHRYETALAWRNEQRTRAPHRADAPWDWVMMTFVNLDAPGLVVLPTHRLVHSLPSFDATALLNRLSTWFDREALAIPQEQWQAKWETVRKQLADHAAAGRMSIAAALRGQSGITLLHLKDSIDLAIELPGALPEQRKLDVLILHELILNRGLGITPEAVREERNLRYVRLAAEALQSVQVEAAQAAFFLNPIAPQQMRDVALAGGVMPQKSTDFYPKLLSGLTMYRVE